MKKIVLILLLAFLFGGCSIFSSSLSSIVKEETEAINDIDDSLGDMISNWDAWSGLIEGYFGDDLEDELPPKVTKAIDELDVIYGEYIKDPAAMSRRDRFVFFGVSVRSKILLIREALELYAPELFSVLTSGVMSIL